MENFVVKPTKYTPAVNFDARHNVLELRGESYPENTAEFYTPCFDWLKEYLAQLTDQKVTVNIELIYFNSSSSKVLMDLFDNLDASDTRDHITVNWIYDKDDEDNLEYGTEFQEDLEHVAFNLVEKEED